MSTGRVRFHDLDVAYRSVNKTYLYLAMQLGAYKKSRSYKLDGFSTMQDAFLALVLSSDIYWPRHWYYAMAQLGELIIKHHLDIDRLSKHRVEDVIALMREGLQGRKPNIEAFWSALEKRKKERRTKVVIGPLNNTRWLPPAANCPSTLERMSEDGKARRRKKKTQEESSRPLP